MTSWIVYQHPLQRSEMQSWRDPIDRRVVHSTPRFEWFYLIVPCNPTFQLFSCSASALKALNFLFSHIYYFEPPVGIEPTTYWLQINCSTSWAMEANCRIGMDLSGIPQVLMSTASHTIRGLYLVCTLTTMSSQLSILRIFYSTLLGRSFYIECWTPPRWLDSVP